MSTPTPRQIAHQIDSVEQLIYSGFAEVAALLLEPLQTLALPFPVKVQLESLDLRIRVLRGLRMTRTPQKFILALAA